MFGKPRCLHCGEDCWEPTCGLCKNCYVPLEQAPTPTDASPGSDEKITIMRWRAENGFRIFHPRDNSWRHRLR